MTGCGFHWPPFRWTIPEWRGACTTCNTWWVRFWPVQYGVGLRSTFISHGARGETEEHRGWRPGCATGLEEFSHLEIVFHFHLTDPSDLNLGARRGWLPAVNARTGSRRGRSGRRSRRRGPAGRTCRTRTPARSRRRTPRRFRGSAPWPARPARRVPASPRHSTGRITDAGVSGGGSRPYVWHDDAVRLPRVCATRHRHPARPVALHRRSGGPRVRALPRRAPLLRSGRRSARPPADRPPARRAAAVLTRAAAARPRGATAPRGRRGRAAPRPPDGCGSG